MLTFETLTDPGGHLEVRVLDKTDGRRLFIGLLRRHLKTGALLFIASRTYCCGAAELRQIADYMETLG